MALVTLVVVGHSWTLLPAQRRQRPALRLPLRLARAGVRLRHRLPLALVRPAPGPGCGSCSAPSSCPTSSSRRRCRSSGSTSAASSWPTSSPTRTGRCGTSPRCSSGACSPRRSSRCPTARRSPSRVSLLAGMYAGDTLDMARVLGLLPFFVMGLKATPERLELLRSAREPGARPLPCSSAIFVLSFWTDSWASTEWLYYRSQYGDLDDRRPARDADPGGPAGDRDARGLGVPRAGAAGRTGWFTPMGAWTLVVYLFHGFVVKSALYARLRRLGRRPRGGLAGADHGAGRPAGARCWPGAPVATRLTHAGRPVRLRRSTTSARRSPSRSSPPTPSSTPTILVEALEEGIADGEQTSPPVPATAQVDRPAATR